MSIDIEILPSDYELIKNLALVCGFKYLCEYNEESRRFYLHTLIKYTVLLFAFRCLSRYMEEIAQAPPERREELVGKVKELLDKLRQVFERLEE